MSSGWRKLVIILAVVLLAIVVTLSVLSVRHARPRRHAVAIAWRKGADGMAHPYRWEMPNGDIWEVVDKA